MFPGNTWEYLSKPTEAWMTKLFPSQLSKVEQDVQDELFTYEDKADETKPNKYSNYEQPSEWTPVAWIPDCKTPQNDV